MNIQYSKNKEASFNSRGFTLIEVMIAVAIFGFLMLYVSQFMQMELQLFNRVSKQNDLDHNARSAMMHIIDEMRLHPNKTYFSELSPDGATQISSRVYSSSSPPLTGRIILVYADQAYKLLPDPDPLIHKPTLSDETPIVIYLDDKRQLWYRDITNPLNPDQLISDKIQSVSLIPISNRLIEIDVIAEDVSINYTYKLVSYMRLY